MPLLSLFTPTEVGFQSEHTFDDRKLESDKILSKYPERIPIIVEKHLKEKNGSQYTLDKKKYLVPADLTIAQFQFVIRKRLTLPPTDSMFFFCAKDDTLPLPTYELSQVYEEKKDDDGFLYMRYAFHEKFG